MRFLFFSILSTLIYSQETEFKKIFERAVFQEVSCDSLIDFCEGKISKKCEAYSGAALILKAKYANSPISKISFFRKGRKKLDDIIDKNPNFVEYRWLRYSLQKNAPVFLNYNKNLIKDSIYISKYGNDFQKKVLK
tara:strand:+ start:1778 stop:2185 length:408 start_codon:yes stop_codon:yes gene_type:complete